MSGAVFVLNAGSSSLKYQLVDPDTAEVHASGTVERIGADGGVPDHAAAVRQALHEIEGKPAPVACGHRVVHGGDRFDAATVVTPEVERAIDELSALAPLHNPANLEGIRAAEAALDVPQVAVFDTAFHRTIPSAATAYAIPAELAAQHQVRKYGFHGTSYRYVSRRAAELLGIPLERSRLLVLHLGNGASACAIRDGRSIDTSMGLTPLAGLVMGTRSGDVDPSVVFHLHREAGLSVDELEQLLNRSSGLKGLAGESDMRDVRAAAAAGDEQAAEAIAVYRHRLRHYIGAYFAELGGLDALVFTAGVGENDALLRRQTVEPLEHLGLLVDPERNAADSKEARRISPDGAPVAVLVVPTNEELEIARQTAAVLG